ncbi:MAG: GNAT family N-acetyltransferase [Steroidobacteraceae bacterium]
MIEPRLSLRVATVADIEPMHRIRMAVQENRLRDPSRVQYDDYRRMLETDGRGWVCEERGVLVGFGVADQVRRNIWALFVAPEHERRDIGRALLDAMVQWLFQVGPEPIWLSTEPGTRAERFYAAAGWRSAGVEPNGEVRFEFQK